MTFILTQKLTFMALSRSTLFFKWKPPFLHLQSIERKILRLHTYPSHRSIVTFKVNQRLFEVNKVLQEVGAIPEIFINGEFNGDLHFEIEVDLHGFLKVKFVFLKMETPFFTSAIDRAKIPRSSTYPIHRSIVTFQVS